MALNFKYILVSGIGATTIAGTTAGIYFFPKGETIENKLISLNENLIKEEKEYQVAFEEFKNDPNLTSAISSQEKIINADSKKIEAALAFKNWCAKISAKPLSDSDSKTLEEKAKKYCVKSALTIGKKISRGARALIQDWTAKFNSIKSTDSDGALLSDLKAINSQITNLTDSGQATNSSDALKRWCQNIQTTNLINDENNSIWGKVEKRCLQ